MAAPANGGGAVGFADEDSARRAVTVLEQADEFFRTGVPPVGPLGVAFGQRAALVVPGTPNADPSLWTPGVLWYFNDGSTAGVVAATNVRTCWLRDLWLRKVPDGGPILLGMYVGERNIGGDRRPAFRTITPWGIKKQNVVTQVALVNCALQWTTKDIWVIDQPV